MSLQDEAYRGAVPVIISLSDVDCTVKEKPAPLTFVLPRSTVLMALRTEVQSFFSSFTIVKAEATQFVWLTWKGEPVPWHYPVGAIKDSVNALAIAGLGEPAVCFSQLSVAELYPTVFAAPLMLEARITCLSSDRPLTVPCPGQEDARFQRCTDNAVCEYLKQVIKGTFSLMYGSIKALMDARSEVINDMLSFATCTSMGEPYVRALHAYNRRIVGLRRVSGDPKNIALMINVPFGKNPLHYTLFRVPIMNSRTCDDTNVSTEDEGRRLTPNITHSFGKSFGADDADCGGVCARLTGENSVERMPLDVPFGEVMWWALSEPYFKCRKRTESDFCISASGFEPFLSALSSFYDSLESSPLSGGVQHSRVESLIHKFIKADNTSSGGIMSEMFLCASFLQGRRLCFIVQGLRPPLCTPVSYLLERFASADGRLYVTLAAL